MASHFPFVCHVLETRKTESFLSRNDCGCEPGMTERNQNNSVSRDSSHCRLLSHKPFDPSSLYHVKEIMIVSTSNMIRRVVSSFLLFEENKVAIFHRQVTMPTFPGHWAAISGSLEINETPLEAAQRELDEETNLKDILSQINLSISMLSFTEGLYVDVPYTKHQKQDDLKHRQKI